MSHAGSDDLNIQISDLFSQRIAVDAEKIGRSDLIASRCR